ncbi:MAG: hypothetical protein ACLVIY_08475 [Anaerobutyricum soehngenii]
MGRNLVTGLPNKVTIYQIISIFEECPSLSSVIDAIKFILENSARIIYGCHVVLVCMLTGGSTYQS